MIQSYPWYLSDWRESETRLKLSLSERALYRELLDYCYLEGSVPTETTQLSRIAGCSIGEIKRYMPSVQPLFLLKEGRLYHAKVDEVRKKLEAYHEQKKHAGAKSGRTRRERSLNVRSIGVATEPGTGVEPSPAPAPAPAPEPAPALVTRAPILTNPSIDFEARYLALYDKHIILGFQIEGQYEYSKIISSAMRPEITAEAIDKAHAEWMAYYHENPEVYRPGIGRWLKDGYWSRRAVARDPPKSKYKKDIVSREELAEYE